MSVLEQIRDCALHSRAVSREAALEVLGSADLSMILDFAEIPREKHFGRKVMIHILDNVKNGSCGEDCSYCAQRKSESAAEIPDYPAKDADEILAEAKAAYESGAYRFCIVSSGRGPTKKSTAYYADIVRRIKEAYPSLHICLSAGILTDAGMAEELASAGLDRYNHNLNTSDAHYGEICTTHSFQDRLKTIQNVKRAGISLCSGVIAGMGETDEDLVDVALQLAANNVESIPVNFFLPVPGHAVQNLSPLNPERCLRILAMFRLTNPAAEIRMAAGREYHLGNRQKDALRAANSLFAAGYLNVRGSGAADTFRLILENGYEIDTQNSDFPAAIEKTLLESGGMALEMKSLRELRPFAQ